MHTPNRRDVVVALAAGVAGAALTPIVTARAARPEARAFLDAVARGDLADVTRRLDASPDLARAHDAEGRSAVVLACLGGHDDVAALLVARGADVDLVEAVMLPDWERAVALAEADPARLDAYHPVGGTAVYAAVRAGNDGVYRLQSLGADADGNPLDGRGVTPAYGALLCPHAGDAFRCLTALLSNGGHADAPQRGDDTLLHLAARRGDPRLVRYLLRRGADPHALDDRGRSPLAFADDAEVDALLRDPSTTPRDDMTTRYAYDASGAPVEWPDLSDVPVAAQEQVTGPSHFDRDGVLEALGDEPRLSFSRSSQEELAVEACGHTGRADIARIHLDHGVPQSLCTSLSIGDLERAKALLARRPNAIHERGPHDFAPLWYTVIGPGGVAAAELLLDAGASPDQDSMGTTALHWAAMSDDVDLAALLLERGATIDAVGYKFDREGQTPLDLARRRGRDAAVRFLEEHGAS